MSSWTLHRVSGRAADLHRPVPMGERSLWCFAVERAALVLGSAQRGALAAGHARPGEVGMDTVVRDSGGGAVLLVPGEHVWIDVVVPRGDPLWDDDVGRSALWLGQVWADAVHDLGVGGAVVHTGPMVRAAEGRHVCFAGLAAGEVTIDGAKLVGISQRRTRSGARFQCLALRAWDIEALLERLHDATGATGLEGPLPVMLREAQVATLDASVGEIEDAVTSRFIRSG